MKMTKSNQMMLAVAAISLILSGCGKYMANNYKFAQEEEAKAKQAAEEALISQRAAIDAKKSQNCTKGANSTELLRPSTEGRLQYIQGTILVEEKVATKDGNTSASKPNYYLLMGQLIQDSLQISVYNITSPSFTVDEIGTKSFAQLIKKDDLGPLKVRTFKANNEIDSSRSYDTYGTLQFPSSSSIAILTQLKILSIKQIVEARTSDALVVNEIIANDTVKTAELDVDGVCIYYTPKLPITSSSSVVYKGSNSYYILKSSSEIFDPTTGKSVVPTSSPDKREPVVVTATATMTNTSTASNTATVTETATATATATNTSTTSTSTETQTATSTVTSTSTDTATATQTETSTATSTGSESTATATSTGSDNSGDDDLDF